MKGQSYILAQSVAFSRQDYVSDILQESKREDEDARAASIGPKVSYLSERQKTTRFLCLGICTGEIFGQNSHIIQQGVLFCSGMVSFLDTYTPLSYDVCFEVLCICVPSQFVIERDRAP